MLSASPGSEYVMSVCDCEDGKRLLKVAAQPNSASVERETFLEHVNQCPVCKAGGTQDCIDFELRGMIATKS
jgi:hypothetical protein